jgi:hypothetical protein
MRANKFCLALGALLVAGTSLNAQIVSGVMAINGAEMT